MKYRVLRILRIGAQVLSLSFFLLLFLKTGYFAEKITLPLDLYFTSDIYLVLLVSLATKTLVLIGLPFLILALLSLIFGRFFCGWVCPLGAVLNFFSWLFRNKPRRFKKPPLRYKYLLLGFFSALALLGFTFPALLDPITILFRTATFSFHPAGNELLVLGGRIWDRLSSLTMLERHAFVQSLTWSLVFLALLVLNFAEQRFWCRYICPYGATLSLLATKPLLQLKVDSSKCTGCGICDAICPASATPMTGWNGRECYQCFLCHVKCPEAAISSIFTLRSRPAPFMPRRRELLFSLLAGVLVASSSRQKPELLRPPGASDDFLKKCVRCGECMKACPTNVLQPVPISYGLDYWSTPQLRTDISYCEYECTLCHEVCPTQAIEKFTPQDKKMGVARVDRSVCLPFAYGEYCIVCEEHCPVPEKAIKLIQIEATNIKGEKLQLPAPVVDETLCIGCGICENKCPQSPKAIRVYPYTE